MSEHPPIPPLDPALVRALDKRFPNRCARPSMSDRDIWMEAGARKVVDFLLKALEEQSQNILKERV